MKVCLSLFLFVFTCSIKAADTEFIDIAKLKNKIEMKAIYESPEIRLELKKKSDEEIHIEIPAGYLFDSDSQQRQNLVLVKTYRFTFKGKKMTIMLKGYCSQANKGAPRQNDPYTLVGYHPDSNLIRLARYIDSNPDMKENIQHAIWVITDHKNRAGLSLSPSGQRLRNYLGINDSSKNDWYTIEYSEEQTPEAIFSDKHLKLKGEVKFETNYTCFITILIKDKNGIIIKTLVNKLQNQGAHNYEIELEIKDWPKGIYEVLIYEDQSNLNQRYEIKI